jgi:hypothetical protein
MADQEKPKDPTSTTLVHQINTTGMTPTELAHFLGEEKLKEFMQPTVAALKVGGGPVVQNRDISGHVHTTG